MHRIYFDKRSIIICPPDDTARTETGSGMIIRSADMERKYRDICAEFKEVDAAGGLVSNGKGEYLLIRRNGLWDLPKGHREPGEEIETTALREVQEETGMMSLELRDLICVTDHCYFRDGIWHLKHTWWYDMLCTAPADLIPQREEGITEAVWVAESDLSTCLEHTFPSIVEVFRNAKK